jgi:hypothetical protein
MARQAVRQSGDLFFGLFQVAIQTPTHVHLHYGLCDRHLTDVTMAGFTIFACPQVSLMTEINEFRLIVYTAPGDWLTALPVACQSLNCLPVSGDYGMAAHTFLHGRYSGYV